MPLVSHPWIRRTLAVFALVTLAAGCSGGEEAADAQPVETAFSGTATSDPQQNGLQGQEEVIEDSDTLARVWAALYAGRSDVPEVPDVDFNGGHLVLIQREFSDGGPSIEPIGVSESGSGAFVTIRQTELGDDCVSSQALQYPWFMVGVSTSVESVNVTIETVQSDDC